MGDKQTLTIAFIGLIALLIVLSIILVFVIKKILKNRKLKQQEEESVVKKDEVKENVVKTTAYLNRSSLYDFMEFDEIKDGMIIRKNREQYVMVVRCRGVNYDLMSEEEKNAVEAGFVQFLNTLRFSIQLYVQTSSLNFREITANYQKRIDTMKKEIAKLEINLKEAERRMQNEKARKISYEIRRRQNVLEYGTDIADYIGRMGSNKNILQQKNYMIISFYKAELGKTDTFSQEELDNMCFSELYTRTQTAVRSLSTCGVAGKILDSEELAELLYIAYNRDDSELIQLSSALNAEYDSLYTTSKDVVEKRQEQINEMIENEAVELATNSIDKADARIKRMLENKDQMVLDKAMEIIDEYKDEMDDRLFTETKKQIQKDGRPRTR